MKQARSSSSNQSRDEIDVDVDNCIGSMRKQLVFFQPRTQMIEKEANLFVCLIVCLFVCLFDCFVVCLFVCLFVNVVGLLFVNAVGWFVMLNSNKTTKQHDGFKSIFISIKLYFVLENTEQCLIKN